MKKKRADIETGMAASPSYEQRGYINDDYYGRYARVPEAQPEPRRAKPRGPSVWRELGALLIKILLIAGVAVLIFSFVYGFHYNVDPAMAPAVKDGDLVMFYRWDKNYKAGDLLLLSFAGNEQVRRVIASAGDTVDIADGGLIINGALQQEPGIYKKTERRADGIDFPVTLRENEVFVLGDSRDIITDSRIYGPVNIDDTQGMVIAVLKRRSL